MQFDIPAPVTYAMNRLHDAGYEAYLVGGCVRDDLLGIRPHDYDVTSSALPRDIKRIFSDYTLICAGEKHGTITPVIDKTPIEITTFRVDGDYLDSRHPDHVTFTANLTEDLARRDFTINAMAWSEQTGLVDPFGGRDDLQAGVIRCVGDPMKRLGEDALRILRGLRFAARFSFVLESGTAEAMRALAQNLANISRERIAQELLSMLPASGSDQVLRAFPQVIFAAIPELRPMMGCPQQGKYHQYDVWEHTLHALHFLDRRTPALCLAVLLHDCGKPGTRFRDKKGADHFAKHPEAGAALAEKILHGLKLPNLVIRRVCLLISLHDTRIGADNVRVVMNQAGADGFDELLSLQRADMLAHTELVSSRVPELMLMQAEKERVLRENLCYTLRQMHISGQDLEKIGFRGMQIGTELSALLQMVMTDVLQNDHEALLSRAQKDLSGV